MYKVISRSVVRLSLAKAGLSERWSKQVLLLIAPSPCMSVLCVLPLSSSLFSFLHASLYLNFCSLILVHLPTDFCTPWDSRILLLLLFWTCYLNLGSLLSFPLQVLYTWQLVLSQLLHKEASPSQGWHCCNCTCLDGSCSCFTALSMGPPKGMGGEAMQGGEEIPAGNEMKGEASRSALGVPPLTVWRNQHVLSDGIEIVISK